MRSVRSRLAVVLGLIVLVPALVAVVAIGVLGPRQQKRAATVSIEQTARAVAVDLVEQCRSLGESARVLAQQVGSGDLDQAVLSAVSRQPNAFAAVVRDGTVVAHTGTLPDLTPQELEAESCSGHSGVGAVQDELTRPALVSETTRALGQGGQDLGTVVVGRQLDGESLRARVNQFGLPQDAAVALACGGGSGASTAAPAAGRQLRQLAASSAEPGEYGGWQVFTVAGLSGQACAVAAGLHVAAIGLPQAYTAGVLAVALVLGVLLVLRLADSLGRPVRALTEAAERVARGDLSTRLPDGSRDELGRLSGAFNHMSDEVRLKIDELERGRDLLRQNVARLGDTLQRTHDLDGLLGTVLQAAASATAAQRATAWLVEGESVVARVSMPTGAPRANVRRLPLGVDIAGEVAADGLARRLGHGHEDGTTVLGGPTLAAPLRRGHGVLGVIVVEREPAGPAFDHDDEAMLVSLAGPAGIAVDNVLLHREAQRLSVTDPLTGAGNLRHMTTTLAREVERSIRFARPLSVLLLDLDHFKNVNDTYGHTVGDAVLRELARRLSSCVREVDTVARYGGEEFVVVTPETDTVGAEHLAERICEAIREEPFRVGKDVVDVTVSVGIASLPIHGTASGDLVRAADEGLYAAKHAGRDQWQVAPGGEVRADR